jgi:hypothetical protein
MMRPFLAIAGVVGLVWTGCGDIEPPKRPPAPPPGIATPPAAPPEAPPAPPATKRVEAGVGVGEKGHYGAGIVSTPLDAYWRSQEAITFNIQIAEAMKLYKAMNDNRGPATEQEFMDKIIKENQIRLPKLPPGHRYVYDPKQEKLMVEQPAN